MGARSLFSRIYAVETIKQINVSKVGVARSSFFHARSPFAKSNSRLQALTLRSEASWSLLHHYRVLLPAARSCQLCVAGLDGGWQLLPTLTTHTTWIRNMISIPATLLYHRSDFQKVKVRQQLYLDVINNVQNGIGI